MAANDIVTRLLLNSTDFDKKIGASRKQAVEWEKKINNTGKQMAAAFKGAAAAIGIATTAGEAFKKFIGSADSVADKFKGTMNGLNTYVNEFFHTLSTGDFTTFIQGMGQIIEKSRHAVEEMKNLQNVSMAWQYVSAQQDARIQEIITNKKEGSGNSDELLAEAKTLLSERRTGANNMAKVALSNLKSQLASNSQLSSAQISPEAIDYVLQSVLASGNSNVFANDYQAYLSQAAAMRNKYTSTVTMQSITGPTTSTYFDKAGYDREMQPIITKYINSLIANALFENTAQSAEVQNALNQYSSAQGILRGQSSMENSVNRAFGLTVSAKAGAAGATVYSAGSYGALTQELQSLETQLKGETNAGKRQEILAEIKRVNDNLTEIKNADEAAVAKAASMPLSGYAAVSYNGGGATTSATSGGIIMPSSGDTTSQTSAMVAYGNAIDDASDSLGYMASTLSSVSSMVNEGAAAWLQYGANVLSAISQAIPAIATLTVSKKAEANAEMESAAAGAASSVASIPYVGAIMAVAAVASVIAALASIPKFATGGVVGGNSFYGDKVLARVNSGELILNQGQQSALLARLDGKESNITINGELIASGRNLSFVLDNYKTYSRQ